MPQSPDVAIVGAGPAGLAAAIELGRRGVRVVVLEAGTLPQRDKPCGEGLMPSGVERLTALGARARLDPHAHHAFQGLRYVSPRGVVAEATFREGPGLGIRRDALSKALLAVAEQCADVEIRTGCRVEGLDVHADGVCLATNGTPVRARFVVGADGLRSRVRRLAGLEGTMAKRLRYGLRQHFSIAPWSPFVEVYWTHGVEAYVTPVGPRCVGIAMLWDDGRRPEGPAGRRVMQTFLTSFPELRERLQGAPTFDEVRSTGPLARSPRAIVADRVALLGDASGYLDAITGEGLSLAFDECSALTATLSEQLERDRLGAADLASYVHAHRRITTPYYRFTKLVLALGRSPWLLERVVAMLARHPEVFATFLDVNMGRSTLGSLGVTGWGKAVSGFVLPAPSNAQLPGNGRHGRKPVR